MDRLVAAGDGGGDDEQGEERGEKLQRLHGHVYIAMAAVREGRGAARAVVKFLLDSGVDVNEENVIQDYVRLPNGAALYPGPTVTVTEIASDLPGSVVVPGRIETALTLTSAITHPETRELLIKAGAK